jgi:capsular polysaccharide export protein
LADRLLADGHSVFRINFNGGDTVYWGARPALPFRQDITCLDACIDGMYRNSGITDVLLFGDRRPVHRPAIERAKELGVRIHVFEEGYFRPYWITLEKDGVNAHSLLPRDPDWYRHAALKLGSGKKTEAFQSSFRIRAVHDVFYHAANMINPLLFPGYRSHAPSSAPVMYAGYLKRLILKSHHEKLDSETVRDLITSHSDFYLLPLQLNGDAQIRDHSSFKNMVDVMEYVIGSFACHAPKDSHLVVKNHPLDMGFSGYTDDVQRLERHFGISGRVHYLETGNLDELILHARGCVTVNSTVGGVALEHGCPTITLSNPVYNMPGLTFQGSLDLFWQDLTQPDAELFSCFKSVVLYATQVNGGFYCARGIRLAVDNSLSRLTAQRSPLEELL